MAAERGYYRHPAIHGDAVVFVCEDDLWLVSAGGGIARRLTANPGSIVFPSFSPDGRKLAFTGRDEGHPEVYSMDAEGGAVRRLTWLGAMTQVAGWSPGGEEILFSTDWRQPFRNFGHLHAVPAGGGPVRPLSLGPARAISHQPGGPGVVIGRNSGDPARWKRYRGGTAGQIWIDRSGNGNFAPLIRLKGNLANPVWIGERIYFLSDHEGCGNLYSCAPTGRGLRRETDHEDYYVRFPSSDGRRIVYHAGADIHLFDPESGESRRIEIEIRSPRAQRVRRFVSASRFLESFHLHPQGHSIACVSRGGVYSMGLWEGAPRRNDARAGARCRLASWLPDGKRIAAITDESGEESILILTADGSAEPRRIDGEFGRVVLFEPAPAGADRVALTNQRQELLVVDLRSGRARAIERSRFSRIEGIAWSPDGRWLAYGFPDSQRTIRIHVADTAGAGEIRPVSGPDFRDRMPAFDPEGKYLYFISDRIFDPVYDSHYFDLGFPKGSIPMLLPLAAETVSPFSAATRPPQPPGAPPPGSEGPGGAAKGEEKRGRRGGKEPAGPVRIDFERILERAVPFPVPEGRYGRILGARGRALFSSYPVEGSLNQTWYGGGAPPAKGKIESHDFDKAKTELVLDRITDFGISADAKVIGVRAGNQLRALPVAFKPPQKPEPEKPGRESGIVDIERIRVSVDPGYEWRQMFREAWRLQRDQFWTPDMSGVNWRRVHDRYEPLVDRVASRAEFSDLMWEMQGELGTSHCYELGGDYRPEPAWLQGFLGADLELDARSGAWRIARIPRGDSWDEKRCSPLAAPGLGIEEGDEILAVGGLPVGPETPPELRLVHQAGQEVELRIRRPADRRRPGKPRAVVVKTLREEQGLRYRSWVESNREAVHERTRGRVGYVHVPDMGPQGYSEFHRYYLAEVNRDGLIVDVRHNGGGHVSQLILEKLLRKRIGYDATRYGSPESYPMDAPVGPMVALTDEYAGSDGDIFSHCFKLYRLGPLIGKRTWGGVVGIWPRHALVDGSLTTQPEFAFWFQDVGWAVENYGTDPDIEVEIRPQDSMRGLDPQLDRGINEVLRMVRSAKRILPDLADRPRLGFEGLPGRPKRGSGRTR